MTAMQQTPATQQTPAQTWCATDLDRTAIFSARALAEGVPVAEPQVVEYYNDRPLSYMAPAAMTLLRRIAQHAPLVPVTTRVPYQYERVALPWSPRYAVCANGGHILTDGVPDQRWRATIDATVAAACAPLDEILAPLPETAPWLSTMRRADELFAYLVVDPDTFPAEVYAQWEAHCAARGWWVSQQGSKVYAMPRPVTKAAAVAEVRRRLLDDGLLAEDAVLLAAGDGALDIDFLALAGRAIRPAHGELHERGYQAANLTVTAARGASAGVEIAQWMWTQIAGTDLEA